jgi:NAD(P)-dependent dehydrogenase (short-subunit alcohol dehydrogenase family)
MRLAGTVAVVTGSARGIGRAIALRLAQEGAGVIVNGRDPASVNSLVAELRRDGATCAGVAADVSLAADVDRLFASAVEAFGRVDLLVNNAALTGEVAVKHLLTMDEEHWDTILRTNLKAAFLCTSRAAALMVARGKGGCIVNISSFSASRAHREMAAYDAAKGGLEAFTRAAALDLAPSRIRVNAVGPGAIAAGAEADASEERARTVPLGRLGLPDDIAAAVAFIASDEASYITGQVLYVDGGMLAQLRSPQVDRTSQPR